MIRTSGIKDKILIFIKNMIKKSIELNPNVDIKYSRSCNLKYVDYVNEYIDQEKLAGSVYVRNMNAAFSTNKFDLLLKRTVLEHMFQLFMLFDRYCSSGPFKVILKNNALNRFALKKYAAEYNDRIEVQWIKERNMLSQTFLILFQYLLAVYTSFKGGVALRGRRKTFKVLREAIWGLYDVGGYYYHDDFLVDDIYIKPGDLLLFSREVIESCETRHKAFIDAKRSNYEHIYLPDLRLNLKQLITRIMPIYYIKNIISLMAMVGNDNISLLIWVNLNFVVHALPYEKIFSNYEIRSELGHNSFSPSHIAEAIVCNAHGAKYYLMHWSDLSINNHTWAFSYLGCDKYLIWGKKHLKGVEGDPSILLPTGYVFKRFIRQIQSSKMQTMKAMGIEPQGKIISIFDETFGSSSKMTAEHYLCIWETALRIAAVEKDHTVIIKPKIMLSYNDLPDSLRTRYLEVRREMQNMNNIYIVNSPQWSFIEVIGISDIVVSQGMTSSSMIAIICGKDGLYLDQAHYEHEFWDVYKDQLVFDEPDELRAKISKILKSGTSAINVIPESTIRQYDEYSDDRGIDIFRQILAQG